MVETHNFYQQKHVGPTCINRKKLSDQLGNGQGFFRTMGYKVILAEKIQSKKENWVVFIFSDYNFGTQLGRYFFLSTLVDGVDHCKCRFFGWFRWQRDELFRINKEAAHCDKEVKHLLVSDRIWLIVLGQFLSQDIDKNDALWEDLSLWFGTVSVVRQV